MSYSEPDTTVSFEEVPPDIMDVERRIAAILPRYPYLVAEEGGRIVGYAYASEHRTPAAYRTSVDVTVYVAPGAQRSGVARRLYSQLLRPQRAWVIMLLLRTSHCQTRQASDCTKLWVSSRLASTGRSDGNLMPGTMSVGGSDCCEVLCAQQICSMLQRVASRLSMT